MGQQPAQRAAAAETRHDEGGTGVRLPRSHGFQERAQEDRRVVRVPSRSLSGQSTPRPGATCLSVEVGIARPQNVRQEAVVVTFLVRHGQTESNLATRYAGRSPEPLTATGRMQIEALARRLGSCGIAEIWSSEVVRARESADIIGGALGLPVRVDARLNEIAMGSWEGLTEAQVAEEFPDAYALWQTR